MIFKCSKCGCAENSALTAKYWGEKEPLCSECSTGKWHGRFPKQAYSIKTIDLNGKELSSAQKEEINNAYIKGIIAELDCYIRTQVYEPHSDFSIGCPECQMFALLYLLEELRSTIGN